MADCKKPLKGSNRHNQNDSTQNAKNLYAYLKNIGQQSGFEVMPYGEIYHAFENDRLEHSIYIDKTLGGWWSDCLRGNNSHDYSVYTRGEANYEADGFENQNSSAQFGMATQFNQNNASYQHPQQNTSMTAVQRGRTLHADLRDDSSRMGSIGADFIGGGTPMPVSGFPSIGPMPPMPGFPPIGLMPPMSGFPPTGPPPVGFPSGFPSSGWPPGVPVEIACPPVVGLNAANDGSPVRPTNGRGIANYSNQQSLTPSFNSNRGGSLSYPPAQFSSPVNSEGYNMVGRADYASHGGYPGQSGEMFGPPPPYNESLGPPPWIPPVYRHVFPGARQLEGQGYSMPGNNYVATGQEYGQQPQQQNRQHDEDAWKTTNRNYWMETPPTRWQDTANASHTSSLAFHDRTDNSNALPQSRPNSVDVRHPQNLGNQYLAPSGCTPNWNNDSLPANFPELMTNQSLPQCGNDWNNLSSGPYYANAGRDSATPGRGNLTGSQGDVLNHVPDPFSASAKLERDQQALKESFTASTIQLNNLKLLENCSTTIPPPHVTSPSKPRIQWQSLDNVGHLFINRLYTDGHEERVPELTTWNGKPAVIESMTFEDLIGWTEELQMAILSSTTPLISSVQEGYFQKFPASCQLEVLVNNTGLESLVDGNGEVIKKQVIVCNSCPQFIVGASVEDATLQCPNCRRVSLVIFSGNKLKSRFIFLRYTDRLRIALPSASLCHTEWEKVIQFGWYCDFPIQQKSEIGVSQTLAFNKAVEEVRVDKALDQIKTDGVMNRGRPDHRSFESVLSDCLIGHMVDNINILTSVDFKQLSPAVNILWTKPNIKKADNQFVGIQYLQNLIGMVPWCNEDKKQSLYKTCGIGKNDPFQVACSIFGRSCMHRKYAKQRHQESLIKIIYPSTKRVSACLEVLSPADKVHLAPAFECVTANPRLAKTYIDWHGLVYDMPEDDLLLLHHYNVALQYELVMDKSNDVEARGRKEGEARGLKLREDTAGGAQPIDQVDDPTDPVVDGNEPVADRVRRNGWMVLGSQSLGAGSWGKQNIKSHQFEYYFYQFGIGFFPYSETNKQGDLLISPLDLTSLSLPFDPESVVMHDKGVNIYYGSEALNGSTDVTHCLGYLKNYSKIRNGFVSPFNRNHPLHSVLMPFPKSSDGFDSVLLTIEHNASMIPLNSVIEFKCMLKTMHSKQSICVVEVLKVYRSIEEALAVYAPSHVGGASSIAGVEGSGPRGTMDKRGAAVTSLTSIGGVSTATGKENQSVPVKEPQYFSIFDPKSWEMSVEDREFIETHTEAEIDARDTARLFGGGNVPERNNDLTRDSILSISIEPDKLTSDTVFIEAQLRRQFGNVLPALTGPYSMKHLHDQLEANYRLRIAGYERNKALLEKINAENEAWKIAHPDLDFWN